MMIALIPHIVRSPDYTPENLRGVFAGADQQLRLMYAPRPNENVGSAPAPPPNAGVGSDSYACNGSRACARCYPYSGSRCQRYVQPRYLERDREFPVHG